MKEEDFAEVVNFILSNPSPVVDPVLIEEDVEGLTEEQMLTLCLIQKEMTQSTIIIEFTSVGKPVPHTLRELFPDIYKKYRLLLE